MNKFVLVLVAIVTGVLFSYATTEPSESGNALSSRSQTQATIIYDGYAYSYEMPDDGGLIAKAKDSVKIYWTDEVFMVDGETGYVPKKFSGNRGSYPMMVNGKLKEMNYYINYKGEMYCFQCY